MLELDPDDRMKSDRGRNSLAVRMSAVATTRLLGTQTGRRLPMVGVTEFPKSGGTWVCQMLASYLGIPFPQRPRTPVLMRCVWHGHWGPPRPAHVLVVRDPRDCYVSLFHHRVLMASSAHRLERQRRKWRQMVRYFPRSMSDGKADRAELNTYIDMLVDGNPLEEPDWSSFYRAWLQKPGPAVVWYEAMRRDPKTTLGKLVEEVVGASDSERVQLATSRFDFDLMRRGSDGFVRRGAAADGWRDELTAEVAAAAESLITDEVREWFDSGTG